MKVTDIRNQEQVDMKMYSPQALAFLGDAVYELLVRERLLLLANRPVAKLHEMAVEQVRASYQSRAYLLLESNILTEEERVILKRGRNASCVKGPKNGNMVEYRRATGVETLFGYLFLSGQSDRVQELFAIIQEKLEQDDAEQVGISE